MQHLVAQSFTPPTVSFESLTLKDLSMQGVQVTPAFRLQNPNGVGFTILSLTYHLEIEGQFVADGEQSEHISVPANGTADVPLPLDVKFAQLPVLIVALMKPGEIHYRVVGSVDLDTPIGKMTLPVDHADLLSLPDLGR